MSTEPQLIPTPSPPTRPIPVSSPLEPEPPPRYRWVAPLFIGMAVGAVIGCGITFTMITLSNRGRASDMAVERFKIQSVLASVQLGDQLRVNADTSAQLGTYARRSTSASAVRRRIEIIGTIKGAGSNNLLPSQIKAQIDAEMAKHGAWSGGGGSSSSSGGNEHRASFESQYYTRDNRQGQLDVDYRAEGDNLRILITIFEAR